MAGVMIRTGGQTGVDRAALDLVLRRGLAYGGWCPHGGWAEDFPDPPGLLARYPRLAETPSADPDQRTAWNVRDSHATLILVPGADVKRFPGTAFTRRCAELFYLRPCRGAAVDVPAAIGTTRHWLLRLMRVAGPSGLVLNVAGPRESEAPGVYAAAGRFLDALFG